MTLARTSLSFVCLAVCLFAASCAAVQPERSAGRQLDDFNASLAIKSAMLRADGYTLERVDVEVTEGVALLSGSAPLPRDRVYAACIAWSAQSVRSVSNTIEIGGGRNVRDAARDSLTTQRIRARLTADRYVRAVNMNIEAYDGVVHLLGFARSQDERSRAAAHAAGVPGVVRVVDLIRVAGETPVLPARGAQQAAACALPEDQTGAEFDLEGAPDSALDQALDGF